MSDRTSDGRFRVEAPFEPAGHQPQVIEEIVARIDAGVDRQTILGVTGSGKTFVMAKVIEAVQRPTIVMSHNKTLSAQLFNEFRGFFPDNAVEYFVSYYDYYQPEAYIPTTGTYIEKDAKINEEIDRLRHRATAALFTRRDCLIIASVSCIYGLGSPEAYEKLSVTLEVGQEADRDKILEALVEIQYQRNDTILNRGTFRVRGDTVEIFPISSETALKVELWGETIDSILEFDPLTGRTLRETPTITVFPAQHYVTLPEQRDRAFVEIEQELETQVSLFKENDRAIEAQRIYERTMYDLEMIREIGYCQGIENYSRPLSGRPAGSPPETLMHYFPSDALIFIDESHVTLPQVGGMYRGDRARKTSLVDYGFRLPSAFDNRPLTFEEFDRLPQQRLYFSATPADLEKQQSGLNMSELIVRPTGLVDPQILIRPVSNQVDDLMSEIPITVSQGFRVLVVTLTKRMSEELTQYLAEAGVRVRYLHSDIMTLERTEIIRDLRLGKFDVLVGINLLREGLDIPECALVAILDADKEGFLRSTSSLIQTCGRAARNLQSRVILYADKLTNSIERTLAECERRRVIQVAYNEEHGITPRSIQKAIPTSIRDLVTEKEDIVGHLDVGDDPMKITFAIADLKTRITKAIDEERFEVAIPIRDAIYDLEARLKILEEGGTLVRRTGEKPRKARTRSTTKPRARHT